MPSFLGMGLRERVRGVMEWMAGVRAVLKAMAELERPPPGRPRSLRELTASPPPRPRPIPAPPRVGRKTVAPAAAKIGRPRQKPRPPKPPLKVKRGQKHR